MRIDKLDILCRTICAFGYLEARVENITQLPDEARLRVDWHGTPFLLYYGWRELPVKYNGQPGSEKCRAHERFERLMKLAEDRGGDGLSGVLHAWPSRLQDRLHAPYPQVEDDLKLAKLEEK